MKGIFCGVLLFFSLGNCFLSEEERQLRPNPKEPGPLERLASSLSEGGILPAKDRLLVLSFTNSDGSPNPYGKILAEKLTTELVKRDRFYVLDRMVHDRILKEQGLSLETDQNLATLRQIGAVLQLQFLVTGIVSPYQEGVFVNCRLIDLKTGLIRKAEEVFVFTDG